MLGSLLVVLELVVLDQHIANLRLIHHMPLVLLERYIAQQDKDVISADLIVLIKIIPKNTNTQRMRRNKVN